MKNLKVVDKVISNLCIKDKNTGCIEWAGYKTSAGYGQIQFNNKQWYAHRLVYSIINTEPVDEVLVCHKCDNPSCVNIEHLFLGNSQDNMTDKTKKGRASKVEHSIKIQAVNLYNSGMSYRSVAKRLGVHHKSVRQWVAGEHYNA